MQRAGLKSPHASGSKADRLNAARQQRERKRAGLVDARRAGGPPRLVALLPLSADADARRAWEGLVAACNADAGGGKAAGGMEVEATGAGAPLERVTLSLPDRRRVRLALLPPLSDRSDPLAAVELGRAAEAVLLLVPGDAGATAIDAEGTAALAVLRALGLPQALALVQTSAGGAAAALKDRSAAKRRAAEALAPQLPGDLRVMHADAPADFRQVLRHLADAAPALPSWRRGRPQLLADEAEFRAAPGAPPGAPGELVLTCHVRGAGLSANQLVHVPGAGDFQIEAIEPLAEPRPANEPAGSVAGAASASAAAAMDAAAAAVLPDPAAREALDRENVVDPLDAEQTWPTDAELAEAAADAAAVRAARKRRLPAGTSDYQAAWILDDHPSDSDDGGALSGGEASGSDAEMGGGAAAAGEAGEAGDGDGDAWAARTEAGTEAGTEVDDEAEEAELAAARARREAEADEAAFPDEVDAPAGVLARERFARFRGLKSFRTSPWDPREDLPADYARVFAFENFRRAHRRAREAAAAAGAPGDARGVPAGARARVRLAAVPAGAAARVAGRVAAAARGLAPPLAAWGLLQHEAKLSVLHFSLRRAPGAPEPVASKDRLLLVTGVRAFPARPILSTDAHGADKHKMERFLREGATAVGTVYAPIAYPPAPVLAFKPPPGGAPGPLQLVATGALRGADPDRVVLKKAVLSGYPVRVHRARAVVRLMFHEPDDVRWFRPVDLWTKGGRRGRIREPVGTHGAMKCMFDGNVSQQDTVCMSLYKRVFPKWPESLDFIA